MSNRDEVFSDATPSEPLDLKDKKMTGTHMEWCDLTGSTFHAVHFKNSEFNGVNMSGCNFNDVTIGGSRISMTCLKNVEIDGNVTGVVINGIPIEELYDAYEKVTGKKAQGIEGR